ncbi:phosphatidylinositol-3,5-bisphosphate 3-phosphatase MTMR14 isoform X2 [Procambarus clarkii]|uniref:phosphatidylinositol-3,5-bisphosphate 3-phosphatase MTMR14 isoform X2 n=1 Tax=Procambarus clarkii TaxID=6728 RepID=UPI001E6739E7|nr:myotubularin-related protein 14-like isoform X2 [Procambarus clarkii]
MEDPAKITTKDIEELLKIFEKNTYRARESGVVTDKILDKCLHLWQLDYKCMVVPNSEGELCNSYPNRLIIPECEVVPEGLDPPGLVCPLTLTSPSPLSLGSPSIIPGGSAPSFSSVVSGGARASISINGHPTEVQSARKCSLPADGNKSMIAGTTEAQSNGSKFRESILKAKFARCRARFPIPTILYKENYICRSATLSGGPEMYGRSGMDYLFNSSSANRVDDDDDDEIPQTTSDWQLFDRVRSQDIRLLKACNVGVIVDLMVEKKKVKFGVYVTSSEKVDKENRYSEFSILSLPYPGCEFFKDFRDLGYNGEGLYFNWNQPFVDAQLVIPERLMSAKVTSDWNNYRKWDLLRLSQNYLKLLLTYIHDGSKGILVHCISGWDRTPLFISLLRLSLWADGLIHSSLDCNQILYLTIGYDWMAFGHDLQDRLNKGEEIFFFCFHFLKYITSDDFSVGRKRHMSNDSSSSEKLDCVMLDADGLSSAGSSNSLNSSCSSNRSSHHAPPVYFKAAKSGESSDSFNSLTWPYGSFTEEIDFDEISPNPGRTSTTNRGSFNRSSARDSDTAGITSEGKLSVRQGTIAGSHSRVTSGLLKNGSSNTSFLDASKPLLCSHRSRNGHSDSSGDSVAGSDHGSWGNGCQEPPRASTSPMAVPVPRGRPAPRTRQESVSSIGSWQLISGTGSLRGSTGSIGNPGSANSRSSRTSVPSDLLDSATTIKEEEGSCDSEQSIIVFNRAERLDKVRSLFYTVYASISFQGANGRNESALATLVSNFAQKVGIKPMSPRNTQ